MLIVGLIVLAIGLVWTLQGMGTLRGSVMTGSKLWLRIGIVCLIVGAGLTILSFIPPGG